MKYEAPVLQEVGRAANLVLGVGPGHGDGAGGDMSQIVALDLGLDE